MWIRGNFYENDFFSFTGVIFKRERKISKQKRPCGLSNSFCYPGNKARRPSDNTAALFSIMLVTICFTKTRWTIPHNSFCEKTKLFCLFLFFFQDKWSRCKELMKQLPNCRGHWCVQSYKLARSCGKLPSTSVEVLLFLNSSSRKEKK